MSTERRHSMQPVELASLVAPAAWLALALLVGVGSLVLLRALGGALSRPLPPLPYLISIAVASALAAAVRLGFLGVWQPRRNNDAQSPANETTSRVAFLLVAVLPTLALLFLLVGFSWAGTSLFVAGLGWLVVLGEEGWSWFALLRRRPALGRGDSAPSNSSARGLVSDRAGDGLGQATVGAASANQVGAPGEERTNDERLDEMSDDLPDDGEIVQQFTRRRALDGSEALVGWFRVPVAAGQRSGWFHLAFCPPLDMPPEVSVEQIGGPEARWQVAQSLPQGARLEWKLPRPAADAETLEVEFWAGRAGG